MRRITGNNRNFSKKSLHKKLFINFIVIFLLLELLFIPFSVASFTTSDGLAGNTKTTNTSTTPPVVGDEPTDSGSSSLVGDDTPTDSGDDLSDGYEIPSDSSDTSNVLDDKSTDSSGNYYTSDDKSSDSSSNYLISDDKPSNSSGNSLTYDNNFYYTPNERIVPTEEIVSISDNILGDLSSGIEKELKIEYFDDIDSVKLTPATDLEEVRITIIKLKDKPEEIIDPPISNISIYKYLDIKLIANDTYVDEDEIDSLEFKFKVEKSWIYNNKIDRTTIKLIRYHDGVWQNLSTKLNSENETYIYYTAASPGFSTFAVVGSKVVEKSESYGSDDSIPWSIIFAFIMLLTIMLIIILFKARYIYLKDDSK